MRLFYLAFLFTVSATPSRRLIGGNSACGSARIRKPWTRMTATERTLYQSAVKQAADQGLMLAFARVHQERRSEIQAHDTCGFVIWHRRFVLAFENMLRSLNTQYACLAVPFWDTMTESEQMVDGSCGNNMQACCPLVTAFGGTPGSPQSRTYNGETFNNFPCYGGTPYEDYPDDNGDTGCVPRNDVSRQPIPSGSTFVSLFSLISRSKSYRAFTDAMQQGVHNEIHNVMGGIMSSFAAPMDALFFSWHGTIDMLLYIWHECHTLNPFTEQQKRSSAYAWSHDQDCRFTTDATRQFDQMTVDDEIFMRADGTDVRDHPLIGTYFRDVGENYIDFLDARSFGDYTYSYDIPTGFNVMLNDRSMCPTAGSRTNEPTPPPGGDGNVGGSGLTYWEWYTQTKALLEEKHPDDPAEVLRQLEYLDCIGFANKFGVEEFSPEFVDQFLEGKQIEPRCQQILDQLKNNGSIVDPGLGGQWGGRYKPSPSNPLILPNARGTVTVPTMTGLVSGLISILLI